MNPLIISESGMKLTSFFTLILALIVSSTCWGFFQPSKNEIAKANLGIEWKGQVINGGPCYVKVSFKTHFVIDHSSLGPDNYWISSDTLSIEEDGFIESDRLVIHWPYDRFDFYYNPETLQLTRFVWENENIDCQFELK